MSPMAQIGGFWCAEVRGSGLAAGFCCRAEAREGIAVNDAPLMLTISGLRGLVGQSLTPQVASRYSAAFGQWLKKHKPDPTRQPTHVVIGRDSRPSGQMIELAAASGLIGVGCRVTCLGIVTTPSVAVMVEHLKADGGMVITASHNPIVWNGMKALRHDGVAPPPQQAQQIIQIFHDNTVGYAPVDQLLPLENNGETHQVHVQRVLAQVDVEAIRERKLKVVLDSVHGAGGPAGAKLLRELGVELVHLYAEPTGRFPHTPEPLRENLGVLCESVRVHGADIGFAQDPDADRLAVADEQGRYIGEEYTLALCCLHALRDRRDRPAQPVVAANLSTSRMIDDIVAQYGGRVVRSPVGEANVADAMRANRCVLGGEGNGGIIWPKVIYVRDSLAGMALLLEMLATSDQPLSGIVNSIPRYAIIKDKVRITPEIAGGYATNLRKHFSQQRIDLQDGVRVDWSDRWIHVRPSNTEPILRMIAEAADAAVAQSMIEDVRGVLGLA